MQIPNALPRGLVSQRGEIEAAANFYVLLREVVAVDQHLADLVGSVRVLTLVRVMVLQKEVTVAIEKSAGRVCLICQMLKYPKLIVSMWQARKANWYFSCV